MTGKTHMRVGMLSYLIFVLSGVAMLLPFATMGNKITLAGVLIAGIAALMPDMDTQRSKINQYNVILNTQNKIFETIEKWVLMGFRMILTIGLGVVLVVYAGNIENFFRWSGVKFIEDISKSWIIGLGIVFGLIGVLNNKLIKKIPGLNGLYALIEHGVETAIDWIKKVATRLVYIALAGFLVYYNYNHWNTISVYLFAVLLIGVSIFPHRTFTHSICEGLIIFSIIAYNAFRAIGYSYLGWCFIIGVFSHLVLTDGITKEGIYISVIHKVLYKLGVGRLLEKLKWYKKFSNFLDTVKIRIPLMSTGGKWGNIFEVCYVIVLSIIVVVLYVNNQVMFQVI